MDKIGDRHDPNTRIQESVLAIREGVRSSVVSSRAALAAVKDAVDEHGIPALVAELGTEQAQQLQSWYTDAKALVETFSSGRPVPDLT